MKFKLNKSIAQVKNFFKPSKMPKLLLIVAILLIVYFIYVNYLKEGFEVSADLDKEVSEGKKVVLFYVDWCGHCKKLKPVWDKAAEQVNKEEKRMLKVNCEGDVDVSKYNIKGYPTIMIFEDGEHKEYNGERSLEDLLALF